MKINNNIYLLYIIINVYIKQFIDNSMTIIF